MTIDERLRRALEARTSSVDPSDDGLERITEKLLDQHGDRRPRDVARNPWFLAAAAAVLVMALIGGFVAVRGPDRDEVGTAEPGTTEDPTTTDDPSPSSTTAPPTSSTTPGPTTTTNVPATTAPPTPPAPAIPADVLTQAAWPRPSSEVRFDDPVAAADSFARYYLRFASPVVGSFRAGDSRSGEVPVQPRAGGPETTVLVRLLGDDRWYVIGATTADIVVDEPATGAALGCPQTVTGRALAFEGTVEVRIDGYQPDGDRVTLGEGFVTGSGSPPAGPFAGEIPCTTAGGIEQSGLVMFREVDQSGDGSTTLKATVHVIDLG